MSQIHCRPLRQIAYKGTFLPLLLPPFLILATPHQAHHKTTSHAGRSRLLMSNQQGSNLNPEAPSFAYQLLNPGAHSFVPSCTVDTPARLDSPTLRGHPHRQASPQLTTPFWQQQPEIAHERTYYYPQLDIYTTIPLYQVPASNMDSTPVVIGYSSKFSRPSSSRDGSINAGRTRGPRQMVKIYLLGGTEVGEVSLGVLTRFSKLAKTTFPRPETKVEKPDTPIDDAKGAEEITGSIAGKKWADVVEQEKKSPSKIPIKTVSSNSAASAPARSSTTTTLEPRHLTVAVEDAWVQPSANVIKHILTWMDQNKSKRNEDPLLPVTPVAYSRVSFKTLIEVYTGVLAFDLQPFPHELRHEILIRLSAEPVKRESVELLYTRLPPSDPIINRMITSFFEHRDKNKYNEEEMKAIQDYANHEVDDDGQLARHYRRVEGRRAHGQKHQDGMAKLREGFAAFAGDMKEALPEPTELSVKDQGKQRGRRDRRRQQRDGKAKAEEAEAATSKVK